MYTCAMCGKHSCQTGETEKMPRNCPCHDKEMQEEIKTKYLEDDNYQLAYQAAMVEASGYCKATRLEETMDFARRCGFKKLGLAFCVGLCKEAKALCTILQNNGFSVSSVICKNGHIPKEFLKIQGNEKVRPGTDEPMCNPIGQAYFLNSEQTDLNIILGLCVGHDSLFIKYSEAPVTVLAVKDRVLAHNPLGALYLAEGYYKDKLSLSSK